MKSIKIVLSILSVVVSSIILWKIRFNFSYIITITLLIVIVLLIKHIYNKLNG